MPPRHAEVLCEYDESNGNLEGLSELHSVLTFRNTNDSNDWNRSGLRYKPSVLICEAWQACKAIFQKL